MVGYVFALNGKLNSAEIYPSNALFRKMWPKLLQASVTEAIGHRNADTEPAPASEVALAFLDEAAKGKASEKPLPAAVQLEVRDADKAFYFETRRASGAFVHRSYLGEIGIKNGGISGPPWATHGGLSLWPVQLSRRLSEGGLLLLGPVVHGA